MTPDYAPITRASALTGISAKTIRAAVRAGKVAVTQDGARTKYLLADIRNLGQKQKPQELSGRERKRLLWEAA